MTNTFIRYIIINVFGDMAQLVERLVRNEEASGSNPLISTTKRTAMCRPFFVCGDKQRSNAVLSAGRANEQKYFNAFILNFLNNVLMLHLLSF